MSRFYEVLGIDADGCTLRTIECDTIKAAKADAKALRAEREYIDAGMVRVQILQVNQGRDTIVADFHV
jgi:hypothetical protein